MPFAGIEGEFEFHIRRQGHEIIFIIRSEETANDRIRAQSDPFDLVATLNDIVLRQELRHLEQANEVEYDD